MSYANVQGGRIAAQAAPSERGAFIARTYFHLAGAIFAFVAIEAGLFFSGLAQKIAYLALGNPETGEGGVSWFLFLGGFMAVSWIADKWARSNTGVALQYAGLGLFVIGQAVIMVPLLYIAAFYGNDPNIIPTAGLVTLLTFGGLTGVVFLTRKDFSFLRTGLMVAGMGALGLIGASILFGFSLGLVFTVAMIALAAGYVLYDTSNVLHHYRTDQHVAASLALFSSVALLFWYILQFFMSRD